MMESFDDPIPTPASPVKGEAGVGMGWFYARRGTGQGNPLASNSSIDARLGIARESKERSWGPWHRMVFQLIDDMA
jgi:hypothetical protein